MSSLTDIRQDRQIGRPSLHSSMAVAGGKLHSSTSIMKSTWFNLTGFVQPATVVGMCNSKDDDGLMDRQLFACPNEIHYDYDEYRPLPESTPCLKAIFKEIDEAHPSSCISTYTLQEDAKLEFIAILHDELNQ